MRHLRAPAVEFAFPTQRTLFTGYDRVGNTTAYQVEVLTGTRYTNYYSISKSLR